MRRTLLTAGLGLGLALAAPGLAKEGAHPATHSQAEALFQPPPAGSYELPVIRRVSERQLLDPEGKPAALPGLEEGQVAVVSFIYRGCTDPGGCPAALAALRRLDRALAEEEVARERCRLVTVSFDPERDRPEKMAELRSVLAPRSDWRFLTAPSPEAVAPVLRDWDQDVIRSVPEHGADPAASTISHLLKVYLVDASGAVRNIYSASYLDWRVIRNDVLTLLAPPEVPER